MEDIKKIFDFFYYDSNFLLERKKDKFDQIIEKLKNSNRRITYKNYKVYIFNGEKNIIVIGNDLEYVFEEINKKISELNISDDGIINEYNTNELKTIII